MPVGAKARGRSKDHADRGMSSRIFMILVFDRARAPTARFPPNNLAEPQPPGSQAPTNPESSESATAAENGRDGSDSLERPSTTLCCSFSFRRQSSRVCPWDIDRDLPQHDWHFDCLVATFQREFEFRSNRVIGRAGQEKFVRIIAAPSLTGSVRHITRSRSPAFNSTSWSCEVA